MTKAQQLISKWRAFREKRWSVYLLLCIPVLLAELFIFNLSSFRTMNEVPTEITGALILQAGAHPGESAGEYIADGDAQEVVFYAEGVNQEINNLYFDITSNQKYLKYEIALSDDGNAAENYSLPSQVILPDLKDSQYITIHPYGNIHTMRVAFEAKEGMILQVNGIYGNMPRPFHFRWQRMLVLYLLLALCAAGGKNSKIHNISFDAKSRKQLVWMVGFTVLCVAIVCLVNIGCGEVWRENTAMSQYAELTKSITKGSLNLDLEVSPELQALSNPYDPSLRKDIDYYWDTAFVNGKYYAYFGIAPVALVYLPYYLLTGNMPADWAVELIFCCLLVAASVWFIYELMKRWFAKAPFYMWPLLSLLFGFSSGFFFLYQRADFYNIPVAAGAALTVCGLTLWLHGTCAARGKGIWYFLGSLCMALVAGCRPQMLLISAMAIPFFWDEVIRERELFSKRTVGRTVLICLPFVIVGLILMYYNYARFGSVFDFGAAYNLTTNDVTRRGTSLDRLGSGLFLYLIQPPAIIAVFPFLKMTTAESHYMGLSIIENMFGGIFAVNLISFFMPAGLFIKDILKRYRIGFVVITSLLVSVVLACLDASIGGILPRYIGDFTVTAMAPACIVAGCMMDYAYTKKGRMYYVMSRILLFMLAALICYDFGLAFERLGDYVTNEKTPAIYYAVRSYFLL